MFSEKFNDWPFLSVHFWGEKAAGTWKLIVTNAGTRQVHHPGKFLLLSSCVSCLIVTNAGTQQVHQPDMFLLL